MPVRGKNPLFGDDCTKACMRIQSAAVEPERKWADAWAANCLPVTISGTRQSMPTFPNQTLRLNLFLKLCGAAVRPLSDGGIGDGPE
jgi:hypothetical protein